MTYKLVVSAIILIAAFSPPAWVDFLVILLATAFVVSAEIINSAIEALCDFVEDRHNEKIKVIKDMAAAAVGISIFPRVVVIPVEAGQLLQH